MNTKRTYTRRNDQMVRPFVKISGKWTLIFPEHEPMPLSKAREAYAAYIVRALAARKIVSLRKVTY